MHIIENLSYDTDFTMKDGTIRQYSHEYPSIGLGITSDLPVLFILTDHDVIGNEIKSCTFLDNGLAKKLIIHDQNLNLNDFYSTYENQNLFDILDEKPVISEILEYPVDPSRYEFIRTALESQGQFHLIRIVIDDIEDFNTQFVKNLNNIIASDSELNDFFDTEMKILLDSNQINFFDVFEIFDWLEKNENFDLKNFPIKASKIYYQKINI